MRILHHNWTPTYLSNSILKYATVTAFGGLNIVLLVVTAMPHSADTIPRFYWAVMVAAIFAVGCIYWLVLKVLQTSIGRIVGIEVKVHDTTDEASGDIPDSLRALLEQAEKDGSRRRLSYKVHTPDHALTVGQAHEVTDHWSHSQGGAIWPEVRRNGWKIFGLIFHSVHVISKAKSQKRDQARNVLLGELRIHQCRSGPVSIRRFDGDFRCHMI